MACEIEDNTPWAKTQENQTLVIEDSQEALEGNSNDSISQLAAKHNSPLHTNVTHSSHQLLDVSENIRPMALLYDAITKVDLVETLTDKLHDPLIKYRNDVGEINPTKIPQKLYIVAITHETIAVAKQVQLGLCVRHGVIYGYVGTHWVEISDDEVKKYLGQIAIKLGYYSPADAKGADFKDKLFKQLLSDGIEEAPTPPNSEVTLINLLNGTLEIDGDRIELREHKREDLLTYCLPYDYNPTATAPRFSKYLNRVLPEPESQEVVQEFLGYAFTKNLKMEKVLVLHGNGNNGKSVLFEINAAVFGKENISHKSLGELCTKSDRGNNHRAEVENKLLNYSSEISPAGADFDTFKAITSQEPVSARRLYKDSFTYRPTFKMIFNANKLPVETERTDAFFRRFIIVPFEVTIPKEEIDIDLHRKIIDKELPGVLNWIVEGLRRISRTQKFTESHKVNNALETYKEESNSVLQFIKEYSIKSNEYEFIPNSELYKTYSEFCKESGYRWLNQGNFSKELKQQGFKPDRKRKNGKLSRGFCITIGI